MDKVIEILVLYWSDWQQTAIDNTRYSVILAVSAIFIGGLIMSILKKKKVVSLMEQVAQEKLSLEKSEDELKELIKKQDDDLTHMTDIQDQLTDIKKQLDQEREEHQSVRAKNDELFIISSHEKQQEVEGISSELTEKKVLIDQLKSELKHQQSKISLHVDEQEKMLEVEKYASESAVELVAVKQQLKIEMDKNNERLEQLGRLKEVETAKKEEGTSKNNTASELENTLFQKNRPLEKSEEKLQPLVDQTAPIEKESTVPDDENAESSSLISGVLGWFSSTDKVEIVNDSSTVTEKPETVDYLQKNEQTIDQRSEQLLPKTESRRSAKENVAKEPIFEEKIEKKPTPVAEEIDGNESSFSEKMADIADRMDAFNADVLQSKFKGFFNKLR